MKFCDEAFARYKEQPERSTEANVAPDVILAPLLAVSRCFSDLADELLLTLRLEAQVTCFHYIHQLVMQNDFARNHDSGSLMSGTRIHGGVSAAHHKAGAAPGCSRFTGWIVI